MDLAEVGLAGVVGMVCKMMCAGVDVQTNLATQRAGANLGFLRARIQALARVAAVVFALEAAGEAGFAGGFEVDFAAAFAADVGEGRGQLAFADLLGGGFAADDVYLALGRNLLVGGCAGGGRAGHGRVVGGGFLLAGQPPCHHEPDQSDDEKSAWALEEVHAAVDTRKSPRMAIPGLWSVRAGWLSQATAGVSWRCRRGPAPRCWWRRRCLPSSLCASR